MTMTAITCTLTGKDEHVFYCYSQLQHLHGQDVAGFRRQERPSLYRHGMLQVLVDVPPDLKVEGGENKKTYNRSGDVFPMKIPEREPNEVLVKGSGPDPESLHALMEEFERIGLTVSWKAYPESGYVLGRWNQFFKVRIDPKEEA
jgi:hypothetical protein